jgi:hypothetical protein
MKKKDWQFKKKMCKYNIYAADKIGFGKNKGKYKLSGWLYIKIPGVSLYQKCFSKCCDVGFHELDSPIAISIIVSKSEIKQYWK